MILLLFAVVVGAFTEQRLRANFDNDVRATAADLQERFRVQRQLSGDPVLRVPETTLRAAAAGGATIRVVDRNGKVVAQSPGAANLGPPVEGTSDVGDLRVVARPLFAGSLDRGGNGFDLSPEPDRRRRGVRAVRQAARVPGRHHQPPAPVLRAGHPGRHRAGLPGRLRGGPPGHGADRRPDPGRAAGGAHARPQPPPPPPAGQRRGQRPGVHARGDAARARRRPRRDRGVARAPARVRGRRLPRAAHAR